MIPPEEIAISGRLPTLLYRRVPVILWALGLIGLMAGLAQLVMDDHEPQALMTDLEYLVDTDGRHDLVSVRTATGWQGIDSVPNFGFREAVFWFRLQVDLDGTKSAERLLELSYPILDSVSLHHAHGDALLASFATGDDLPFANRPIRHRNFVFPLMLQPGSNTLILRIETDGVVQAPLTLWEPLAFIEFYETQSVIDGAYFGIMVIMIFYNLILYASIRETPFLYYVGHVATATLFLATMHGLGFMHLWPEWIWWQSHAVPVLVALSVVFIALFVTAFLEIPAGSRLGRAFTVLVVVALVAAAMAFVVDYAIALKFASVLSITALTSALVVSIWGWVRGNQSARFLVLAWSAFVVGSLALAFNKIGLLPRTPFTESGMLFGSMLDVVLLSIAMADRVRQERLLREAAQARAMQMEQRARARLEHAVAERTEQLEEALGQLQRANRRLESLSNLDELTEVYNRRYFDRALEFAWHEAEQQNTPLCLLLADADRFKDINDSFGHPAGDEVLRQVARTIAATLDDRDHVLARIGGEEFVVLLPGVEAIEGGRLAEAIRTAVAGLAVEVGGQRIETTVSIGVAAKTPGDQRYEDLVVRTDRAVYQAKADGRNRVETAES